MANPPVALTEDDLHTAQALLELHGDEPNSEEQNQVANGNILLNYCTMLWTKW